MQFAFNLSERVLGQVPQLLGNTPAVHTGVHQWNHRLARLHLQSVGCFVLQNRVFDKPTQVLTRLERCIWQPHHDMPGELVGVHAFHLQHILWSNVYTPRKPAQ